MISLKTSRTDFLSRVSFQCSGGKSFSVCGQQQERKLKKFKGRYRPKIQWCENYSFTMFSLAERDKMKEENG